jgi:hypothetical protein
MLLLSLLCETCFYRLRTYQQDPPTGKVRLLHCCYTVVALLITITNAIVIAITITTQAKAEAEEELGWLQTSFLSHLDTILGAEDSDDALKTKVLLHCNTIAVLLHYHPVITLLSHCCCTVLTLLLLRPGCWRRTCS